MNGRRGSPWLTSFAIVASGIAGIAGVAAAADTARTSIPQLYSLPSIIGTSPEGYAWSRDGRQLAYLWNDDGLRFRDIWIHSLASGASRQLTHYADDRPKDSEHAGISEVVWLGNGAGLAYVLDGHLYRTDGKGRTSPLEPTQGGVHGVQLSADARRLAFLADAALWVMEVGGGQPARRVSGNTTPGVYVERYEWSADARTLAFVELDDREVPQIEIHYFANGESRTHRPTRPFPGDPTSKTRIGVARADGAQPHWLELPDALQPVWGLGLSADGRRVFVDSSDFLIKERSIYLYDVATGHREMFFRSRDATRVLPSWSAAWAPGDEGLIVLSDDDGFFHLYHVREARGAPRRLTGGEWEVASFEVDARSRSIHFVANEAHRAELQLYRVPLAGGAFERLSRAAGTHAPVYSPDFRHAADRFSSDTTPPDLYLADLRSSAAPRRITTSPRPEFAQLRLAKISYVQFKSHVDGTLAHGRLSLPADFDPERRYPLLMGSLYRNTVRNRWGGGNEIPTWGLDQHLSDRGYVLMKVDTRGSWGSGSAARRAVHHDFGGIDIEDVESGVRYMMTQGYVEPGRVGVWGWSYGGLMTLMSLFKKPDLYAAGIADAPASNVAHAFPRQMWVMGRPEGADFPQRYERMSALNFTAGLTKPLMITHANKDDIVLYGDTIAVSERLIAGGKTFELVTLPGSSHIWARDSLAQQRFGYTKMAEFFDRYLQPGRQAAP